MMAVGERRRARGSCGRRFRGARKRPRLESEPKRTNCLTRNRSDRMCRHFGNVGRGRTARPRFSLVIRVLRCFFLERLRFGECDSNAGNASDGSFPFGKAKFEKPSRFLTNLWFAWNPDHFVITKHTFVVIV